MSQAAYSTASLHTRPRLLLVDDDAQQLELSAYIINLKGYSVVTATGPTQALALAKRQRPDLAIVDYEMPVMNGCILADRLRVMIPKLHIILYTGALGIPDSDIMKVSAFISKSDGLQVLLGNVSRLLHSSDKSGQETPRDN
jgi:CheY-like chemotaxis protein